MRGWNRRIVRPLIAQLMLDGTGGSCPYLYGCWFLYVYNFWFLNAISPSKKSVKSKFTGLSHCVGNNFNVVALFYPSLFQQALRFWFAICERKGTPIGKNVSFHNANLPQNLPRGVSICKTTFSPLHA